VHGFDVGYVVEVLLAAFAENLEQAQENRLSIVDHVQLHTSYEHERSCAHLADFVLGKRAFDT